MIKNYKEHILNNIKEVWHEKLQSNCWIWQKCCYDFGYGCSGYHGKVRMTHRISYQEFIGSIPEGLKVLHHCDVRACCNPAHLFVGTDQDNMDDMTAKGRGNKLKGIKHGRCKLTEQQIIEIRAKYVPYVYTMKMLAEEYGVSYSTINRIISKRNWRHI